MEPEQAVFDFFCGIIPLHLQQIYAERDKRKNERCNSDVLHADSERVVRAVSQLAVFAILRIFALFRIHFTALRADNPVSGCL